MERSPPLISIQFFKNPSQINTSKILINYKANTDHFLLTKSHKRTLLTTLYKKDQTQFTQELRPKRLQARKKNFLKTLLE